MFHQNQNPYFYQFMSLLPNNFCQMYILINYFCTIADVDLTYTQREVFFKSMNISKVHLIQFNVC